MSQVDYDVIKFNNFNITVLPKNKIYRYGDILYQIFDYKKIIKKILNDDIYNKSLLFNYLNKIHANGLIRENGRKINFGNLKRPNLSKIQKEVLKCSIYDFLKENNLNFYRNKNELVVNLRCGDHIVDSSNEVINFLKKHKNIVSIKIVTSFHFHGKGYINVLRKMNTINKEYLEFDSKDYNLSNDDYIKTEVKIENCINYLKYFFNKIEKYKKIDINISSNGPDIDFINLIMAVNLVCVEDSGFSKAAIEMNTYLYNNINTVLVDSGRVILNRNERIYFK
tara:strand:- start:3891 stop:4733 length:843 start_codon:yes stop_codon:yes gene_type:complete